MNKKRIVILGCTGSIGRQTLEVVDQLADISVCGLAAGANRELLVKQARRYRPEAVALTDAAAAVGLEGELPGVRIFSGPDAMTQLVWHSRPQMVLSGVVGAAGLAPTLATIEVGADLAIANKETLVMAGQIVMPAARHAGVAVLPVDSEHSAIFQCLAAGRREEVRRVTITSSGGALRELDDESAAAATVQQALSHPTWQMGPKITIDSATLINKSLELVEAHWLFDLDADMLEVVLHPESIIHAFIEFCDGSVIAQMAQPDMTLPIAYALARPHRPQRDVPSLDLVAMGELTFRPLAERCRRAVNLGLEVIRRGGTSGAVLNSANEAAVQAFLQGRITFGQIVPMVEDILNQAPTATEVTLKALMEADSWARSQVARRIETLPQPMPGRHS